MREKVVTPSGKFPEHCTYALVPIGTQTSRNPGIRLAGQLGPGLGHEALLEGIRAKEPDS